MEEKEIDFTPHTKKVEIKTVFLGHKKGCPWVKKKEETGGEYGFMMIPTGRREDDLTMELECVECMELDSEREYYYIIKG